MECPEVQRKVRGCSGVISFIEVIKLRNAENILTGASYE
jgi:hypothetical protein